MIVSYYITYTNHFDEPGIRAATCKINNFFMAISVHPKYYCTQLSCVKISCGEI